MDFVAGWRNITTVMTIAIMANKNNSLSSNNRCTLVAPIGVVKGINRQYSTPIHSQSNQFKKSVGVRKSQLDEMCLAPILVTSC